MAPDLHRWCLQLSDREFIADDPSDFQVLFERRL